MILDYGCPSLFTAIVVTNGNSGGKGDTSTGSFTIYGSNDFVNKTVLVSDTLPDPGPTTVSFSPCFLKLKVLYIYLVS